MKEFLSRCGGAGKIALRFSLAVLPTVCSTTYRNLPLVFQSTSECIQVAENGGDRISPVTQKLLCSDRIIADVIWVVEQSRLSNGNEIFKETLTGSGQTRVRNRVEGPTKANFVACHDEELSDSNETFSHSALKHLRSSYVFRGWVLSLVKVDIICDDILTVSGVG